MRKVGLASAAVAAAAVAAKGSYGASTSGQAVSLSGLSTVSSMGGNTEWTPKTVLVRGWAPFGAPPSAKLNKVDYKCAGERLRDFLPLALKAQVSLAAPFALNHQVSFIVRDASSDLCHRIREALQDGIARNDYVIKGVAPRVAVELSPRKRVLVKNMFRALDALKAANIQEDKYDVCHRACQLFALPSYGMLGSTPAGGSQWEWDEKVCAELDFDPKSSSAAEAMQS